MIKIFNLEKKKDLIKKFIEENLPTLKTEEDAKAAFDTFWSEERKNNLKQVAESENISVDKLEYLINEYFYTQKLPGGQEIVDMLTTQPKILERQGVIDRIRGALENIIEVFEW
ncbi:MAG: hypothetical protein Q9M91_02900 [Candidatus Dojkabacteria bacterium]|nr:hypothetical protein [Candidatus Dojkabacteria bacterium]